MIDSTGTRLYAINGDSNNISAFNISGDGSLTTIAGSPYPSGGQDPASIGLCGSFLVVANKNQDPHQDINGDLPNYVSFKVSTDGSLTQNAKSTVDLAQGSSPSQALMVGSKHIFFGLEFMTSRIATFKWEKRGIMNEVSSIPSPSEGDFLLGEVIHPTQRVLYAGLIQTMEVAVYSFDAAGNLTFVRTVPNAGLDVCWFQINAAGTRLYACESASETISVLRSDRSAKPGNIATGCPQ